MRALILCAALLLLASPSEAQVSQAHVDTLIARVNAIRPHNQSVAQHRQLGEMLERYRALAGIVVADPVPVPDPVPPPEDPRPEPLPLPEPEQPPATASCTDFPHTRRVAVSTSAQLTNALGAAQPGDLIHLADGVYGTRFTVTRSGTVSARITLCGTRNAVLRGAGYLQHAPLRAVGVNHNNFHGFTVEYALWGIQLEKSSYNRLSGLLVHDIGQEAVGIRDFSTHNVVENNDIRDTGKRTGYAQYGEGIYMGSWTGKWIDGQPDRSDHNQILNNRLGPNIPSDHLDLKEGTSFTVVRGNVLDLTGFAAGVAAGQEDDTAIAMQSNDALIENNTIIGEAGNTKLVHGIRVWTGQGGWGARAVFRGNRIDLKNASGYGVHFNASSQNTGVIYCAPSNAVTGAALGLSNISCVNP